MKARINALEAKVEADIKHFDTTILKDSSDQKELKDTRIELEQHKVELTKVISPDDLEPIGDRMTYLEDWEPSQVARMEDKLHH
ncbi:unnamed protein product [Medioppia subpectinata]|uniref:Uncharacterized protein n=1 Tax=Medioppia subpectinata TaxID=1979941 RepID=A0A7R9KFF5_9ACAR|nr:unnamed protein product [Medioppia subpectinata]CAG2101197.1 unnamed protein product [Medioppia subpectinata]